MRTSTTAAGLLAVAVAGCGGASTGSAACTVPSPTPAGPSSVAAGALTASVDRSALRAGGTLRVMVAATGPAAYTAPCDGPLQLLVVADAGDLHVYTAAPTAARGTPCGSVQLGAGQRAEYDADWTPDPTLPAGVYRAVLTLGDQPPLVLRIALGTSAAVSSCSE